MKVKKNIFKFLKIFSIPLILLITNFIVIMFFSVYFSIKESNLLKENSNLSMNELMKTNEYSEKLAIFFENNSLYITLITFVIVLPIFIYIYKKIKHIKKEDIPIRNILMIILLFILISGVLNIFSLYFSKIFNIKNYYTNDNVLKGIFIMNLINTCLLGPIIEELIYRGIIYNKLKTFNSKKTSIILTTIIFSISHITIVNIIYAFIIGLLLNIIYSIYNDLKLNIIIHSIINLVTLLIIDLIIKFNFITNISIVIISIIFIIIIITKLKKLKIYVYKLR